MCLGRLFLIMAMSFLMAYQPFLLMGRLGYAAAEVPESRFSGNAGPVGCGGHGGADRRSAVGYHQAPEALRHRCSAGLRQRARSSSRGRKAIRRFSPAVALFGIGLGAYLSVDLALVTDVLPNKEDDAARDLGLFNIASALPQSMAPAIASGILLMTGGAYGAVFIAAGIAGVCAALAVAPVRSVR